MKIILEGVDGSGKTTLAKILAFKYGLDICHCTYKDPGDYPFYLNTARKDDVVWDRHTIGELIYPEIFEREGQIGTEDVRLVLGRARKNGAKIFVLTCDIETLKERIKARGTEDKGIVKNLAYIDKLFKFFAEQYHVPVIDTTKLTLQQIFELVEKKEEYKFISKEDFK